MPEPITIMTLGCIISGVSLVVSAGIGYLNIKAASKFGIKQEKQEQDQRQKYIKRKEKIKTKYMFNSNADDYLKIACLMNLEKNCANQCSHLTIDSGNGNMIILTMGLQNIKLSFLQDNNQFKVKAMYNETDGSIWITFPNTNTRDVFETYIKYTLNLNSLMQKILLSETRPPDENDYKAYATLGLLPPKRIPVYASQPLLPSLPSCYNLIDK